MREIILAAGFAALTLSLSTNISLAAPLTSYTPIISPGNDTATAYYIGASASDTNVIELSMSGASFFDNKTTPIGTEHILGNYSTNSQINLKMIDLTVPNTWYTGDGSNNIDHDIHFDIVYNPELIPGFNLLSSASKTYALDLESLGDIIVGVEDRAATSNLGPSDFDYNDVVFGINFTKDPVSNVNEPNILALLALSILSISIFFRRTIR